MQNTYFIGDTHFGHTNILKYEPLRAQHGATIEEHNEYLIEQWNSVVRPQDKVYHLGDVAFGLQNIQFIGRCNGDKILIAGNHDHYGTEEYLKYFRKIYGCSEYKRFILSHMPVHHNQLEYRQPFCIHGHMHSKQLPDPRYINVSAECIGLKPISFDEILERVKDL